MDHDWLRRRARELRNDATYAERVPNGLVVNRVEEAVRLIEAEIVLITR